MLGRTPQNNNIASLQMFISTEMNIYNPHCYIQKAFIYIYIFSQGTINLLLLALKTIYLIKDIILLERVQHRATNFILNNFQSSYKSCLLTLNLLPLMYLFEIHDIIFLLNPSRIQLLLSTFITLLNFIHLLQYYLKLTHQRSSNIITQHFFFNIVPHLWNVLPVVDILLPTSVIHSRLNKYF